MMSVAFGKGSVVALALVMAASPAVAQDGTGEERGSPARPAVEVTPFVSMGSPTSSRVGGAVAVPLTKNLSLETELGYRRGEGDIDALSSSVSVLYALPDAGRVLPYVAAGVGLEEFGTPVVLPSGIFTQSKLAFAVNAGGGIKVPVDDTWSLRSDARWYKALGRNGSEHWRLYQGATYGVGKRGESRTDR